MNQTTHCRARAFVLNAPLHASVQVGLASIFPASKLTRVSADPYSPSSERTPLWQISGPVASIEGKTSW